MSDQELIAEIRRGLITIMRALMRRFGLAWADFMPRDAEYTVTAPYQYATPVLPYPTTTCPINHGLDPENKPAPQSTTV